MRGAQARKLAKKAAKATKSVAKKAAKAAQKIVARAKAAQKQVAKAKKGVNAALKKLAKAKQSGSKAAIKKAKATLKKPSRRLADPSDAFKATINAMTHRTHGRIERRVAVVAAGAMTTAAKPSTSTATYTPSNTPMRTPVPAPWTGAPCAKMVDCGYYDWAGVYRHAMCVDKDSVLFRWNRERSRLNAGDSERDADGYSDGDTPIQC